MTEPKNTIMKSENGLGDNWGTPPDLWEELRAWAFPAGAKIFDPCPSDFLLQGTFTSKDILMQRKVAAFEQPDARAWLKLSRFAYINPPFSEIGPWVREALLFGQLGGLAVCLVPSRPSRPWWQVANRGNQTTICDRVSYVDPATGQAQGVPGFDSVIIRYLPYHKDPTPPTSWWPECHKKRVLESKRGEWYEIMLREQNAMVAA